ncbi:MAG: polysaccharide deacetylase family protein [Chitinophagaceae bacterium]|nr:polysaccharide deacetylase family protein [Chitinophagaceae bacterium]
MGIAIVVSQISPRLAYTLDWVFGQQLGIRYELLSTAPPAGHPYACVLQYGKQGGHTTIPAIGLLSENKLQVQQITAGTWEGLPVLFYTGNQEAFLPFDLFSAVFYLLSRYEEYLPFTADKFGRYPATESILYRHQLLERPIIDEWLQQLSRKLGSYGVRAQPKQYAFLPTYDIDIAWSYRHKGWKRTLGGYLRDVAARNFAAVKERTSVLLGHQEDPYDSFDATDELHTGSGLNPVYFILAAKQNGPYDKHILPSHPAMKQLIGRLAACYETGMHPSYATSEDPGLLREEHALMERCCGKKIDRSRQHYIRCALPDVYRNLIAAGIRQEYSMGYATHLGFRAGTSQAFPWYDLQAEQQTELQVFPFCFMDTSARFELGLSAAQSFEKLQQLQSTLQQTRGLLITVFHNFSLGTDPGWQGWQERYAAFIKQAK